MTTPIQRRVLATTCTSHALIHVYELAVPPLLLLIQREFDVGDLAMGRVIGLYGLLFGLGSLPAGYLVDRLGSKSLLLLCLWGSSAAMVGMALSPSLSVFAVCAAAMGACLSIYHPAGTALITHVLPTTGRVFALHGMAGNTGVALSAAIAGGLGAAWGWRGALGGLSIAGFVLGVVVLLLPGAAHGAAPEREARGSRHGFVWLLVGIVFMGMVYRGMTTFLPKLFALRFADDPGAGTAVGGTLTTAALLVGLAGMWTAGKIADRGVHPAWVFCAGALFQIPFLVAIGHVGGRGVFPLVMVVAYFHFFTQPVGNQMVARFTPPRLRGLGYGIYFFVSFGVGAAGATLAGWASERLGLAQVFPVLAAVLIPSVAAMAVLGLRSRSARLDDVAP